jgi:hypothetical protein
LDGLLSGYHGGLGSSPGGLANKINYLVSGPFDFEKPMSALCPQNL